MLPVNFTRSEKKRNFVHNRSTDSGQYCVRLAPIQSHPNKVTGGSEYQLKNT